MKGDEKTELSTSDSHLTLFRFELNRSQTSLFLILSLIGIFMLTFSLVGDIFLNLFRYIFSTVPRYLEQPGIRPEGYLFYTIIPTITSLILSIIFISLSIYGVRKILKNKTNKNGHKRKTITQNRTVNWLGLKLSHGQALFIFSASIPGVFLILQFLLDNYSSPGFWMGSGLLESLCWIPDGPNTAGSHELLLTNVPIAILITFLIICLYSLFTTRRGSKMTSVKKITKNYSLLIFIGSFVVFVMLSARIFCHLAMFNYEVSYLLGISYHTPNSYQNEDFIRTIIFFCICLILMISRFFLKERNHKEVKTSDEISWFRIKLTPHRVIILISSALIWIIFFIQMFLFYIFRFGNVFSRLFFLDLVYVILFSIIIFCYYPIGKILKNHRFDKTIENIDNSQEFSTNWFKYRLNKTNSVILLSVSSTFVIFYLFQLISMNIGAQSFLLYLDPHDSYMLFSFPFMTIIIIIIIVVNIYTIKKTLPSIRNFKSLNSKSVDNGNGRTD